MSFKLIYKINLNRKYIHLYWCLKDEYCDFEIRQAHVIYFLSDIIHLTVSRCSLYTNFIVKYNKIW